MILTPHRHRALIDRLLAERPAFSAADRFGADPDGDVIFDRSDWVSALVDRGNTVSRQAGRITATRAITLQGRLIWLVQSQKHVRAYHSRAHAPDAAIADAERAWQRRANARKHREEVFPIVRALRTGRLRYRIRVEDAYASPLCEEGVDGFLRSLGLARFRSFPGWFIAWAFALDRQVGFVIWEAHQRHLRESDATQGPTASSPAAPSVRSRSRP